MPRRNLTRISANGAGIAVAIFLLTRGINRDALIRFEPKTNLTNENGGFIRETGEATGRRASSSALSRAQRKSIPRERSRTGDCEIKNLDARGTSESFSLKKNSHLRWENGALNSRRYGAKDGNNKERREMCRKLLIENIMSLATLNIKFPKDESAYNYRRKLLTLIKVSKWA